MCWSTALTRTACPQEAQEELEHKLLPLEHALQLGLVTGLPAEAAHRPSLPLLLVQEEALYTLQGHQPLQAGKQIDTLLIPKERGVSRVEID